MNYRLIKRKVGKGLKPSGLKGNKKLMTNGKTSNMSFYHRIESARIHCECHHKGCRCVSLLTFPEPDTKTWGKSSLFDAF
jgi:hypothetical protein